MKGEHKVWLVLLLFVAVTLRFWCFVDWSLTNDELSALSRLKVNSLSELIQKSIWTDGHPALTQIFLYYWVKIFGNNPFIIRLPFALMSSLGIYLFYKSGEIWFHRKAALFATSILVFSQYFILYGSLARPYAIGFFLVAVFTYFWSQIIVRKTSSAFTFIALSITAALTIMTHYFAALSICLQLILGFFYLNKQQYKAYFMSVAGIILLCLPHLNITLHHLSLKGLSWLPLVDKKFFSQTFFLIFNQSLWWIFLIFIIPLILSYQIKTKYGFKKRLLFALLFILPIAIGYAYSHLRSPVLHRTVILFCLPFFFLLIASFIPKHLKKAHFRIIILAICAVGLYGLNVFNDKKMEIKKYFIDFKGIAEKIIQLDQDKKHERILHFAGGNNSNYLTFYTKKLATNFLFDYYRFETTADIAKAFEIIDTTEAKYIYLSQVGIPIFPEIQEYIKQNFGHEGYRKTYNRGLILRYDRGITNRTTLYEANFNKTKSNDFYFDDYNNSAHSKTNKNNRLIVKSKSEYPIGYRSKLGIASSEKNRWINIDFNAKSNDSLSVQLVISINRKDSTIYWRSYDIRGFYEPNQWYAVKRILSRPTFAKDKDELSIFLWNIENESFSINDFSIRNFADSKYEYLTPH